MVRVVQFLSCHTMQIHLIKKNGTRLTNVHLVFDCFIGVCVFKEFVDDESLASIFMCVLL